MPCGEIKEGRSEERGEPWTTIDRAAGAKRAARRIARATRRRAGTATARRERAAQTRATAGAQRVCTPEKRRTRTRPVSFIKSDLYPPARPFASAHRVRKSDRHSGTVARAGRGRERAKEKSKGTRARETDSWRLRPERSRAGATRCAPLVGQAQCAEDGAAKKIDTGRERGGRERNSGFTWSLSPAAAREQSSALSPPQLQH